MNKYLFLCFLVSALAATVQSKPHEKKHHVSKHPAPEKQHSPESIKHTESKGGVLPTFLPFESSTQDTEDEDMREDNESRVELKQAGANKHEVSEGDEENTPLLLSEEALTRLLRNSEEAEEPVEEDEDGYDHPKESKDMEETEVESNEDEESTNEETDGADESESNENDGKEIDSSTDSEIPVDLDYTSVGDVSQPLSFKMEEAKASTINTLEKEVEKTVEDVSPTKTENYGFQQSSSSEDPKEDILEEQAEQEVSAEKEQTLDELIETLQDSENEKNDLQDEKHSGKKAKKEKNQKNESLSHGKGKAKKRQKKQWVENIQSDQASTTDANEEHPLRNNEEVDSTENTKPKKKNGKWARLVGMNPVQIKATMELYPDIRPTHRPSGQEVSADPCDNFRCKRGKTCKLKENSQPNCVCQEPSECPPSLNAFDHVCGTDNKTYDTSCQLFATKCNLEGTKKGHRLHLDYTGSCKLIAPCLETELVQFPLRMRDWLKNVLLQLFEHDSISPGFLTAKQRIRVQKIYESERRLQAGDHPVELLLQDFEKNYNMYIYPVHWQFAQMDQHPSDRLLSHSELAPLRAPLVPMEHCTSVFFQKCDDDKDKLVSFREWCNCFGIEEEDMDANLLF